MFKSYFLSIVWPSGGKEVSALNVLTRQPQSSASFPDLSLPDLTAGRTKRYVEVQDQAPRADSQTSNLHLKNSSLTPPPKKKQ